MCSEGVLKFSWKDFLVKSKQPQKINGWKLSGKKTLGEGKSSDPDPSFSGSMLIFGGVDAPHDQS